MWWINRRQEGVWGWSAPSSKYGIGLPQKSQHCTQPEVGTFWQSYDIFSRWPCLQISPVVHKLIYVLLASHLLPFSLYICPITLFRNSSLDIVRDWPLSVYLREGQSTSIQSALFPHLHLTDITLLVIAILIEINPHHHHIGFQLQLTLTNLLLVRFPYLFHLLRVIACTVSVN